jgi:nitrate/nitrite transport system substrate-binding protein
VTKEWAEKNPKTHLAVVKALIRGAMWLDAENNKNRTEASEMGILHRTQKVVDTF